MRNFTGRIGFMQGRFSPLVDGRIQAFPWQDWQQEFELAARHGFSLMEWTLDQERLYENPLMTRDGRREIEALIDDYGVLIPSLTGDCFMQAPFYKAEGRERELLLKNLVEIIKSCAQVGIKSILIPLVDDGRLEHNVDEKNLIVGLEGVSDVLEDSGVNISFESDFPPEKLARFIDKFESKFFGITYDIGNSAALGYLSNAEIEAYGNRIMNVHVKDRMLGGTTVGLGEGNANIPEAIRELLGCGYQGNFILQTARAKNGDHIGLICEYRDMVAAWLDEEAPRSNNR